MWRDWSSDVCSSDLCIGEGNGNPLQCSFLENPRDRGAWWAAVYGVAQSRTQLKRLSSSSSRPFQGKGPIRTLFPALHNDPEALASCSLLSKCKESVTPVPYNPPFILLMRLRLQRVSLTGIPSPPSLYDQVTSLFQTYVCREHSGLYLGRASQGSLCSETTWEA